MTLIIAINFMALSAYTSNHTVVAQKNYIFSRVDKSKGDGYRSYIFIYNSLNAHLYLSY